MLSASSIPDFFWGKAILTMELLITGRRSLRRGSVMMLVLGGPARPPAPPGVEYAQTLETAVHVGATDSGRGGSVGLLSQLELDCSGAARRPGFCDTLPRRLPLNDDGPPGPGPPVGSSDPNLNLNLNPSLAEYETSLT